MHKEAACQCQLLNHSFSAIHCTIFCLISFLLPWSFISQSTHPLIHPLIHLFTNSPIHLAIQCWSSHSAIYQRINPSIFKSSIAIIKTKISGQICTEALFGTSCFLKPCIIPTHHFLCRAYWGSLWPSQTENSLITRAMQHLNQLFWQRRILTTKV